MKVFIITAFFIVNAVFGYAQTQILPDSKSINGKLLKNGKYQMDCYMVDADQKTMFGTFKIEVKVDNNTFSVFTNFLQTGSSDAHLDTAISSLTEFHPIYRASSDKAKMFSLHYDKEVTGLYIDKVTGKRTHIKESIDKSVFDNYVYPYMLGALSLEPDFKAKLAAFEYKSGNRHHIHNVNINGVESTSFTSKLSGERSVWKVNVFEEATKDQYSYYIDKELRKLWKVDILTKGRVMEMVDNELTLGNTSIVGQVFARDNQNEGLLSGIAIVNINKKQYAPVGTLVYLIPGTPYFENYKENVKKSKKVKNGIKPEPLSEEFMKSIRTTSVKDEKGNYEFNDIPEGDYYVVVTFGYEHTHIGTETVGQTHTYVNGNYQGSSPINRVYSEGQNASAYIEKKIRVNANQGVITQNLKKTL